MLVRHVAQIKALQQTVVSLTVQFEDYPPLSQRAEIEKIAADFGHVTIRFGFVEMPSVVMCGPRRCVQQSRVSTEAGVAGR